MLSIIGTNVPNCPTLTTFMTHDVYYDWAMLCEVVMKIGGGDNLLTTGAQ